MKEGIWVLVHDHLRVMAVDDKVPALGKKMDASFVSLNQGTGVRLGAVKWASFL